MVTPIWPRVPVGPIEITPKIDGLTKEENYDKDLPKYHNARPVKSVVGITDGNGSSYENTPI